MKFGIRSKLIVFISGIIILGYIAILLYTLIFELNDASKQFHKKNLQVTQLLARSVADDLYFLDVRALRLTLSHILFNPDVKYAYIFDANGWLLTDGTRRLSQHNRKLDSAIIESLNKTRNVISTQDQDVQKLAIPIVMPDNRIVGYALMGFDLNRLQTAFHQEILAHIMIWAGAMLLGMALVIVFSNRLSKPIRTLAAAAQRIGRGHWDTRVSINRGDEIGMLANAINTMAYNLSSIAISRSYLENIVNSMGNMLIVTDTDFYIVQVNDPLLKTLDYSAKNLVGRPMDVISPGLWGNRLTQSELLSGQQAQELETEFITRDGKPIPVLVNIAPLHASTDSDAHWIFTGQDINQRKQMEEKLRQAATVFENTTESIIITNAQGSIIAVNRAFMMITGYCEEEVFGKNPRLLNSGHQTDAFYEALWASLLTTGQWQGEIWNRRKNGEVYPGWLTISAVYDTMGKITHYVGALTDISAIKRSQEKLDYLAHHDPLTGLPNRLLFNIRLSHAIDRAQRNNTHVAILFLDLDRFKNVNDSLGHPIGDELLISVANRLQTLVRHEDTVVRLGGDEFVILMEDLNKSHDAHKLAQKIIDHFRQPFSIQDHILYLSTSIGISLYPDDGQEVSILVKNADAAMYRAKEQGRNNYQFYTEELTTAAFEKVMMETQLRKAIDQGELTLYYQPQVVIATGQIIGVEVLLRWQHPSHLLMSPIKFIPLAEESSLIIPMGEWVIRTACRQLQVWKEKGIPLRQISVNLSGKQLQQTNFIPMVWRTLHETGCTSNNLELEITESFLMDQTKQAIRILRELKDLGVRLAIDDFGTGYSSLSYLKRLPINKLKIDQSFVRGIPEDPNDKAIARAIIGLGKNLGLTVIAEGIETQQQQAFLKAAGCEQGQGYLYGRPVTVEEFDKLLQSHYSRVLRIRNNACAANRAATSELHSPDKSHL